MIKCNVLMGTTNDNQDITSEAPKLLLCSQSLLLQTRGQMQ